MILKSTRAIVLGVVFNSLLAGCAVLPPKLPPAGKVENIDALNTYLESVVETKDPPGLSVVVVKNGETVFIRAFGKADGPRNIDLTTDSVFQWWSLTKVFTALAIMQLDVEGQLSLSDRVDQHLPFFKVHNKRGETRDVTVRQLLSHSAGMDDIGLKILGWIHYDGDPTPDQTELLQKHLPDYAKLKNEPGEIGRYSNLGYLVLAALIESASGQRYQDYINERILSPLEMNHTSFIYTDSMRKDEAIGSHPRDLMSMIALRYMDRERAIRELTNGRYWFKRVYSNQKGATGLIGSSSDIAKFMTAFLECDNLASSAVIDCDIALAMATPVIDRVHKRSPGFRPGLQYGLGWHVMKGEDDRQSLTHGGSGAAFVDFMRLYPKERLGIAVMANSTYLGRTMGESLVNMLADMDWPAPR